MMTSRLMWTAVIVAVLAGAGCDTTLRLMPMGPRVVTVRPYSNPGPPPYTPPPPPPTQQGQPPPAQQGQPPPAQPTADGPQATPPEPSQPDPDPINVEAVTNNSIFVEPVSAEERTIYLDVHSGVEEFDPSTFEDFVTEQFKKNDKHYEIIDNPRKAHFYLVANVLNLTSNKPVNPGARRQVVAWMLVCDIQIKELAAENEEVATRTDSKHRNGDNTTVTQTGAARSERKEYRTRITTTARGVNLKLQDAQRAMFRKTAFKMSGFF